MNEAFSYKYADGSGNVYQITKGALEYIPVTRKESSSLVYSGGKPATVPLRESDFLRIREMLENFIARTDLHIEHRVMMSGVIVREDGEGKKEVILRPGSREILTIETELNKLLNSN